MKIVPVLCGMLLTGCVSDRDIIDHKPDNTLLSDTSVNRQKYREPIALDQVALLGQEQIRLPGSVVGRKVGHLNGYYSFSVTSTQARYDIVGTQQLIKAKHEFEIVRDVQAKTSSTHFWDGAAQVGKNILAGLTSLFFEPHTAGANIYSASGKLARKLSETDGLNDMFSDSPEKRELASQLKLDVYSQNPEVQAFLIGAAANYSRGQLFGKALTWLIPASPVSFAVSIGSLNAASESFLENRSPTEVVEYCRNQLLQVGCSSVVVEKVLANRYLTPRSLLYLTRNILQLHNVRGGIHIPLTYVIAAQSKSRMDTVYMQIELFVRLHRQTTISELFDCGYLMGVVLEADRVPLMMVPYDYFELNDANKKMLLHLKDKSSGKTAVWCRGAIDPDAVQWLTQQKYVVRTEL